MSSSCIATRNGTSALSVVGTFLKVTWSNITKSALIKQLRKNNEGKSSEKARD